MVVFYRSYKLLLKMYVIIDVVDTKAVIAVASGAISELQVRVVGIGFTADGAFVPVGVRGLFVFFLLCGFPEINGLLRVFHMIRAQNVHQIVRAENDEIQNSDNRQERVKVVGCDHI